MKNKSEIKVFGVVQITKKKKKKTVAKLKSLKLNRTDISFAALYFVYILPFSESNCICIGICI